MTSESKPEREITEQQLAALLRDVHVPTNLKQELLSIADENTAIAKQKTKSPPSGQWLALATSLAAVALFGWWVVLPQDTAEDQTVSTTNEGEDSSRIEARRLLAEIKQQQIEFEYQLAQLELRRLNRSIDNLLSSRRSQLSDAEIISTVLAMADQTPIILGAPPETVIDDMQHVVKTWPGTQGAIIASNFIQQQTD